MIERARQAGVTRIVIPAIDLETAKTAIRLSDQYAEVFCAVGFHPNDLSGWSDRNLSVLENLAQHPKVIAIGEIGLDYYRDRTARDVQQRVFRAQLELAERIGKPVIIHCRDDARGEVAYHPASEDVMKILSEHSGKGYTSAERLESSVEIPTWIHPPRGVLHSFSGPESIARQAILLGFFIGITGPVTFPNARNLQSLVKSLPLDCLLIETDAPFLPPQPHRGERNEPAYVGLVAEKIAELHGLPVESIGRITTHHAERLFGWKE